MLSDELKFDHARARNLSNVVKDCKRSIDELNNVLKKEVDNAGQWWRGESYDAFKATYDDLNGIKASLDILSEKATKTGNYVVKVTDSKKNFEKSSSNYFK